MGEFNFSFGAAQKEDEPSIVASQGELVPVDADELPGFPPLGVAAQTGTDAEMVCVLAAANIRFELIG